ncbi:DUF4236 domain-containing protein [Terribacillus saccharophilus]|uniref:DUF4236 domain-containing protein n=1 Tax=Terribacillus saccharophilus TaxID=361277 RepID=UPI0039826A1F
MGLRMRKSFKVAPGVRLNVSSKSMGISAGTKGLRYSVNSKSGSRMTASIPGTGISYSTGSSKRKSSAYIMQQELLKQEKEKEKMAQLEQNKLEVELFENGLDRIRSIHIEADDFVDWHAIAAEAPPYKKGEMGPQQQLAESNLRKFKPSFMQRVFKRDAKIRQELLTAISKATQNDSESYELWERDTTIAKRVLAGETEAYFEVIDAFAPLDDLLEYGSGFEFYEVDEARMEIVFKVHSDSVVPSEQLSLTKTGKVSRKQMTKTRYYDIQQDYIASCIIRIARDMFALLPLHTVFIHAVDDVLDTSTGHTSEGTLLSVEIDRHTLQELNLEHIDCSDALANFKHKMDFRKTMGFRPIDRVYSKKDSDFI